MTSIRNWRVALPALSALIFLSLAVMNFFDRNSLSGMPIHKYLWIGQLLAAGACIWVAAQNRINETPR
jgi:hypothetical protein